jgi:hypothetical protein
LICEVEVRTGSDATGFEKQILRFAKDDNNYRIRTKADDGRRGVTISKGEV